MAIIKLDHLKEGKGRNPSAGLYGAILYILDMQPGHNGEKTKGGLLIGGNAGITADEIYELMIETKEFYGKNWGRVAYHFVLSFPPGEVTAEEAHELTGQFVDRYIGDRYDVVFTTHDDQEHKHSHILFNSLSRNGYKYHYKAGDWEKDILPILNDICIANGLSYITLQDKEGRLNRRTTGKEKWQKKQGHKSWDNLIRQNLQEAMQAAGDYNEFLKILRDNGYQIREGNSSRYGPYFSIQCEGMGKARRNYRLGAGYSVEDIKKQIADKELLKDIEEMLSDVTTYRELLHSRYYRKRMPRLASYYYRKCIFLCTWNNRLFATYPKIKPWKYRQDIKELDKHMDSLQLTDKYKIQTLEQLIQLKESFELKKKMLNADCRQLKKKGGEEQRKERLQKLKEVRKELRTIQFISDTYSVSEESLFKEWKVEKELVR
ncbi:hypothetical protein M2145_002625 [Lachnospiraceae bacterium PF1-21]|uniref:Relaxase/mobilization nuclease domain-containing protein n=1 Tax=Ohessyouella blattaphilus TaxID=2949333 RepID=A0ABT1EKM5_9FIRM|nr:relaxase/mobilization nuclease domain-containing protein [Ohessyouella blattaphilus]MCP1111081.1 relaxase/mobilization nuclease domain-containing protein [Ohessyouella blattaphilus]MCR8564475.1 relaxase/mobilization nuclease domain-containing protein [Ohessyouella blattaphilus]